MARIDVPGMWYHVMARGQRRNPIFFSPADRRKYLEILDESFALHDADLGAYCLIGNHLHLLVFRRDASLGKIFNRAHGSYGRYFNQHHDLVGHVFQGRFKSKIVLDERYLNTLIRYIHQNPVEAGLVRSPQDFHWSSDSFYRKATNGDLTRLVRAPGFEGTAGARLYRKLIQEPAEYPESTESHVGSVEELRKVDLRSREIDRPRNLRGRMKLTERIEQLAAEEDFNLKELKSKSRLRRISGKRGEIMARLYREGYSPSEIAAYFGRTPSAVLKANDRQK